MADTLNFNVESDEIPRSVFALQAAVGLLAPILAAAYPVYKGTRVTVHQALNDYGVGQNKFGTSDIDLLLGQIRGLTRPFLLSLRNTFRRRGRLILTLGTLAVGGAVFIAATSVRASLLNTIDDAFNFRLYDVDVRFSRPYRIERIEQHARDIPGVVKIESWSGSAAAVRVYPDDTEGDPFNLIAPPATTEFIQPAVVEGRWLLPGDENGLVVNNELLDGEPDIDVGDEIVLKIGGRETTWQVIGIVREVMASPGAYANYAYFAQATRQVGYANSVRVATRGHDETSYAVMQSLEQSFEDAGLDVLVTLRTSDVRKYIQDHFSIMTTLLLLMSILIAIVGGLGLASTMSINVIERTREIGVMRAIGASTRSVLQIIVVEGVLIGVLSWCVAAVLALPLSIIISNALGMMLLQTTLSFVFSLPGLATWFVIVVIFTAAASFSPAWSASRLTVRQVLAYE